MSGQHPVEQDQVRPPVGELPRAALAILRRAHLEAGAFQAEGDHLADRLLVLDHQDARFSHERSQSLRGHRCRIMTSTGISGCGTTSSRR